jgi:hypothetical protein
LRRNYPPSRRIPKLPLLKVPTRWRKLIDLCCLELYILFSSLIIHKISPTVDIYHL